jgi:fructose-1,6-bisphosphatase/inositol monophosphatase family enzyme
MPWDHLAGALIVEEAGGHVACLDSSPYRPGVVGGGLIGAVDRDCWQMLRREIFTLLC